MGVRDHSLAPTTRATNTQSRSCEGLQQEKASTGFARGNFRFRYDIAERDVVLMYCGSRTGARGCRRGARWCCCVVGCGGRIPIDCAPRFTAVAYGPGVPCINTEASPRGPASLPVHRGAGVISPTILHVGRNSQSTSVSQPGTSSVCDLCRAHPARRSFLQPVSQNADRSQRNVCQTCRLVRFRFRYDIAEHEVALVYCGLQLEDPH